MIESQTQTNITRRRMLFLLAAAIPVISLISKDTPKRPVNSQLEISLADAKKDEKLRQAYLEAIFQKYKNTGGESWQSIENLVYDPFLEKLFLKADSLNKKIAAGYKEYFEKTKYIMMAVPYYGNDGKKSTVHVTKDLFKIAENDDEVCVEIDNESVHAMIIEKGHAHIPIPGIDFKNHNLKLSSVIQEILSFEMSFYNILTGKRKVRQEFLNDMKKIAKEVYKPFFLIVNSDDIQLSLTDEEKKIKEKVKYLHKQLEKRGTLEYFL